MTPLPEDHHSPWREVAERQQVEIEALKTQLDKLSRHVFGKRSEKMPSVEAELRRAGGKRPDPEAAAKKRRDGLEAKKNLPTRTFLHRVPEEKKSCPRCQGPFKKLGGGRGSTVLVYVPGHFERHVHVQETWVCGCGQTLVTAEGPERFGDQGLYDVSFVAHLVTHKCSDAIPLYRLKQELRREGIDIAESTMVDPSSSGPAATPDRWPTGSSPASRNGTSSRPTRRPSV